jgi:hypothetical protein
MAVFPIILSATVQAILILVGFAVGQRMNYPQREIPNGWTLAGLFVLGLFINAAIFELHPKNIPAPIRWPAVFVFGGLAFHVSLVMLLDPFTKISSPLDLILAVAAFLPLLFGMNYSVKNGYWLGNVGSALFLYTAATMLGTNTAFIDCGQGFTSWWFN